MLQQLDNYDILFDCNYFNIAWGLRYYGFYITRSGKVCRYGEQKDKKLPDLPPGSTIQDLFIACRRDFSVIGQVDPDTFAEKTLLADAASKGMVVESIGAIDAGVTAFLAYPIIGDEPKEIVLQLTGDRVALNQSAEAGALIEWLNAYWSEIEKGIF